MPIKTFSTRIHRFQVEFLDRKEFHSLKNEIWQQQVYFFDYVGDHPYIVDIGAYIGLSTLYFKYLYPTAEILAIEPHPFSFKILQKNIWQNNLFGIDLLNVAVAANQQKELVLHQDPQQTWLSSVSIRPGAWNRQQKTEPLAAKAIGFQQLLVRPIDFLKMDIEGAEVEVLLAAKQRLAMVEEMAIEFHAPRFLQLKKILQLLTQLGYRFSLSKKGKEIHLQQAKGLFFLRAKKKK